jgi:hypothetical protein
MTAVSVSVGEYALRSLAVRSLAPRTREEDQSYLERFVRASRWRPWPCAA